MTNNTSKDIIYNAISTLDISALNQISQHCKFSVELAVKYADDTSALMERTDIQKLTALRDACVALGADR